MNIRIYTHVKDQLATMLLRRGILGLFASALQVLVFATSVTVTHASNAGDALSLTGLPIGQNREVVLPVAEAQWASVAKCTTLRTGVGLTKRAYFLETCVLDNPGHNTLYDETPISAHYVFLEDRLVQVGYQFTQVDDLKMLRRCAENDVQKHNAKQTSQQAIRQGVSVADDGQTLVFDTELVPQIHSLNSAK